MKGKLIIAILVLAACVASRLFFINSNVFFFDGDEAIVSLMALDVLDGKFPLYFYGQNYGLSIVEAVLVSVGVLLFGASMLAVKIPMLVLWSSAVSLMAVTFYELLDKRKLATALFVAVMVLSPTWLVWSMKARGGYLTSFFFSSLVLYLLIGSEGRAGILKWTVVGLSLALVYEAQPIWLPPLLLIVAFYLWKSADRLSEKLKFTGVTLVASAVLLGFFAYEKAKVDVFWATPRPNIGKRLLMLDQLPDVLMVNLGGNYFLSTGYEPSNAAYALVFLLVFVFFGCFALFHSISHRKVGLPVVLLMASLFSFSGFLVRSEPRYLLPFLGFALFTMAATFREMNSPTWRKVALGGVGAVVLVGLSVLPRFRDYSFVNMSLDKVDRTIKNDEAVMKKLIRKLEKEGVRYVFTTNEFLQYQINFMTEYEILAVGRKDRCRTPQNVDRIMAAYPEHADEFAVIGYNFRYRYSGKLPLIDNKIFYIVRPSEATLQQVGFFN